SARVARNGASGATVKTAWRALMPAEVADRVAGRIGWPSCGDLSGPGQSCPAPADSEAAVVGKGDMCAAAGSAFRYGEADRERGIAGELRSPFRPFDQDDGVGAVEQTQFLDLVRMR